LISSRHGLQTRCKRGEVPGRIRIGMVFGEHTAQTIREQRRH
jgi:hypothetical protein